MSREIKFEQIIDGHDTIFEFLHKVKLQKNIYSETVKYNNQLMWNDIFKNGNMLKM